MQDPGAASNPPATQSHKERRWPIGLLVGFITAMIAVVAVVPIADWGMREHHVSNMEGGRGFAMVFCWMPLAFGVAFLTGFIVSLTTSGSGFVGYLKRQGISLAVIAVLFAIGAALSYASADHPPLIDDKTLALEIEVRVPAKGRSVEQLREQNFDVALVVSASDRNYSDVRWSEARSEGEFLVVPAWAPLNSRNAGREITAGVDGENRQIFNVMRTASPKTIDETWSEWTGPKQRFDGSMPAAEDAYQVRYRVRYEADYSPTPHPMTVQPGTPEDSPTPTPTETPSPEATGA